MPGWGEREIPPDLGSMLTSYAWPGNVRELRNVMERYTALGGDRLDLAALFDSAPLAANAGEDLTHLTYHEARRVVLDRFERAYLPALLAKWDDNVSRAAVAADLGRGSLHRMLHRIRKVSGADDV
jgi:transcriptional regulator with PAS, ATPase and Fis domain